MVAALSPHLPAPQPPHLSGWPGAAGGTGGPSTTSALPAPPAVGEAAARGPWPPLTAGAGFAAAVLRPGADGDAAPSLRVSVIALAAAGQAMSVAATPAPAIRPAVIVAVGADGRPVLATGTALLRLDATTALPAGTGLMVKTADPAAVRPAKAAALHGEHGEEGPLGRIAAAVAALFARLAPLVAHGRGRAAAATASARSETAPVASAEPWFAATPPPPAEGPATLRMVLARDGSRAGGEDRPGSPVRFVLSIQLSRLGPVELDASLDARGRRCDLAVRTDAPLPPAARAELRTLFAAAGAVSGLAGTLAFARRANAAPPNRG